MSRGQRRPPSVSPEVGRVGKPIDRRSFVQTSGGILLAASTLSGCTDKLPPALLIQAPTADPSQCTISVSPASVPVAGVATLTLQAKDATGANLTAGGDTVAFTATGGTSAGTISATTDHGDGTYTATYTGTTAGTAQTIHANINGSSVTTTLPTVTVTAAVASPDPTKCTVTAAPTTIAVAGTSTLTLQAKDSTGTNLTVGGAVVVFTASGGTATGTISATTDHGNGTYTATYTATGAGSAQTIHATINSSAVTTTLPTVTVTAAAVPDPTKCTVTASPATISISSASLLTLQAKDNTGANITTGGATVVFSASGGTSTGSISSTTDHGDGTYTANYTGTAAGTAQTIGATINGAAVTTTMPTVTVSSSFVAPDIVNNESFESGWGRFKNWSGGTPFGNGTAQDDLVIATDYFYAGTHSMRRNWTANNAADVGSQCAVTGLTGMDRVWVRFYFRFGTLTPSNVGIITTYWKFSRWYNGGLGVNNMGGLFIAQGSDCFCFVGGGENSDICTTIGLKQAQACDGNWHSLEYDYWRNGDPSGWPSAGFWFDGQPQYAELNGHSTIKYYGAGNVSYWDAAGRLQFGMRSNSLKMTDVEWLATLNANNGTTGQVNLDLVAISSLGRIGP